MKFCGFWGVLISSFLPSLSEVPLLLQLTRSHDSPSLLRKGLDNEIACYWGWRQSIKVKNLAKMPDTWWTILWVLLLPIPCLLPTGLLFLCGFSECLLVGPSLFFPLSSIVTFLMLSEQWTHAWNCSWAAHAVSKLDGSIHLFLQLGTCILLLRWLAPSPIKISPKALNHFDAVQVVLPQLPKIILYNLG